MVSVVMRMMDTKPGFTLSELLIALVVLGIVAAFTIPKVLEANVNARNNVIAKECAGIFSSAFHQHRYQNVITSYDNFRSGDLIPYVNYADRIPLSSPDCPIATVQCIRLHNSTIMGFHNFPPNADPVFINSRTVGEVWVDIDGAHMPDDIITFWITSEGKLSSGATKGFLAPAIWGPPWPPHDEDPQWFQW